MNELQSTEHPPLLNLTSRIAYGAGCGAMVGVPAAFLASMATPMPGGQNAMAAVFLGPAVALLGVICVGASMIVGVVAAASRIQPVIFLSALVIAVLILSIVYYDSDPIARSFVPSIAIASVISGLIGIVVRGSTDARK